MVKKNTSAQQDYRAGAFFEKSRFLKGLQPNIRLTFYRIIVKINLSLSDKVDRICFLMLRLFSTQILRTIRR